MATLDQIGAALKAADAAGNKEDAAALAREYARMSAASSTSAPTATNPVDAAIRAAAGGASFNLADEIAAAGNATVPLDALTHPKGYVSTAPTWSQRYAENLAKERGTDVANAKAYPVTTVAGNVAGAIPLGMMVGAPSSLGGAALQGVGIGGAYGFGQGEGGLLNRIKQAALGAGTGAAMSGGLYKAADAISPVVSKISSLFGSKTPVPTTDELKDAARAAYKQVDNSGLQISPDAMSNLATDVNSTLSNMGFHPKLQPKAAVALDELQSAADKAANDGGISLQNLEVQRRIAGQAAKSIDPSDKMMARVIQNKIDDFVSGMGPNDVVGQPDPNAIDALNNARDLWARSAKGQIIDSLIDKAKTNASMFSGSGYENALRTQFRRLANNPQAFGRFSPDEQDAIAKVATGGSPLSLTNMLRQVGKLSPQGAVPLLAEIGGVAAGGPSMLAIPAAGLAGRMGATALTARNAQIASELARLGQIPAQPAPGAATMAIQNILRSAAPASSVIPLSLMGGGQ